MKLGIEINENSTESVLISSELSPNYFEYNEFSEFVDRNFSCVKVIFTIRRQSEILSSLFNQLIKDDNVRYRGTIFSLAMNNLDYLDFYSQIRKWSEFVGIKNIIILQYGERVVDEFLSLFSVKASPQISANVIKNPSLPYRSLLAIQEVCKGIDDPEQYKKTREKVVELSNNISLEHDKVTMFSVIEQVAVDDYFRPSNLLVEKRFNKQISEMSRSPYRPIMAIEPSLINL